MLWLFAEKKFEEVCAEKTDLLRQLKELSQNLSVIESSYLDSKETADLTMSQLVQVQQELEHYYLMSCNLMSMVERYSKLETKSIQIMSKLSWAFLRYDLIRSFDQLMNPKKRAGVPALS